MSASEDVYYEVGVDDMFEGMNLTRTAKGITWGTTLCNGHANQD